MVYVVMEKKNKKNINTVFDLITILCAYGRFFKIAGKTCGKMCICL